MTTSRPCCALAVALLLPGCERTDPRGKAVAASKDNPEFIVETAKGKQAAHKASALKKD
jgi:hypothetical protein